MIRNYVKIALKVLARRKFFTFISLFAITLTLVVLMVAAAILDHSFSPMPPETRQDRTLAVQRIKMSGPHMTQIGRPGYKFLNACVRTLPGVELTSIFSQQRIVSLYKDDLDLKPYLKRTDGEFWRILDFTFVEGGPYASDDVNNVNFVAVINQATKEKLFGSGPAVGNVIEADRQRFRIVGVVANVPIYRSIPFADIWVPMTTDPDPEYASSMLKDCTGLILARSSSDFQRIKDEFALRAEKVELPTGFQKLESEPGTEFDDVARDLLGNSGGHEREMLLAAIVLAAILFMLLPTVNLVNINISRIMERASEIGVRKSFGASSRSLVGQFLVENILLTAIGGVLGFILSTLILTVLSGSGLIQYADFHLNIRLFLYALASILVFGVLSGVYPAWRMARMHPVDALKGGSR